MVGWGAELKGWWWWVKSPELAAEHLVRRTMQAGEKNMQWGLHADDTPGLFPHGQGFWLSLHQGLRHSQLSLQIPAQLLQ